MALKAFTDQKRRFFPHLDDGSGTEPVSKRHFSTQTSNASYREELSGLKTVLDVLLRLEKEVPNVKTFTYQRLDWLKRASSLISSSSETSVESLKEHNFHSSSKLRQGSVAPVAADQIAVIELLLPAVFRVVISLHPAGSIDPDAVAFFSPDEVIFISNLYDFLIMIYLSYPLCFFFCLQNNVIAGVLNWLMLFVLSLEDCPR